MTSRAVYDTPARETISAVPVKADRLSSLTGLRVAGYTEKSRYEKADLPAGLESGNIKLASEAYSHLEMKGYARMDVRLDPRRGPIFLEMNSNPDLSPTTFGLMASWMGLSYNELLSGIIKLARSVSRRPVFRSGPSK
jgi:D-alanine-D-alanine ligase-like ATP-grasp enzyme